MSIDCESQKSCKFRSLVWKEQYLHIYPKINIHIEKIYDKNIQIYIFFIFHLLIASSTRTITWRSTPFSTSIQKFRNILKKGKIVPDLVRISLNIFVSLTSGANMETSGPILSRLNKMWKKVSVFSSDAYSQVQKKIRKKENP